MFIESKNRFIIHLAQFIEWKAEFLKNIVFQIETHFFSQVDKQSLSTKKKFLEKQCFSIEKHTVYQSINSVNQIEKQSFFDKLDKLSFSRKPDV